MSPEGCRFARLNIWGQAKNSNMSYVRVLLTLRRMFSCLDYLVQRRLEITAQYDLRCSLLDDVITRTTVQVTSDSHSVGLINTICDQGVYVNF